MSDDDHGYDFPPSDHPGRELFTFVVFVLVLLAAVGWIGWKLLEWLGAAIRPLGADVAP